MFKSVTAMAIVGLGLKDSKALWALTFVVATAVAGVIHLVAHQHVGSVRAVGDLAVLDVVGCLAYVLGAVVF